MLSFKHTVFLEVARLSSFTKASEVLFISQPAITKHIQQLEDQYRTRLFERNRGKITLTTGGQILFRHLEEAKLIERQLELEISSLDEGQGTRGELKLGASTTVALYIIPPVLSGFLKKYHEVKMSLINRNSDNILNALLDEEIDLGILEGKKRMKMVHMELFLTDEVIPVCSSGSRLAKTGRFSVKELTSIPIALRERGSGTLATLKSALALHGIKLNDLNTSIRLGGTEALKNFILADESLGFLPMKSVNKELQDGSLVRLFIEGLTVTRQFFFAVRHGDRNNKLSDLFIKFAKSYYNIKL